MLDTGAMRTALNLGYVHIYEGTEPVSADDAITDQTLLVTISNNAGGTGITMEASAASGVISKNAAETWSGNCVATGTAMFYRHVGSADDASASTTQPRIQGDIGLSNADMILDILTLVSASLHTVNTYTVRFTTD